MRLESYETLAGLAILKRCATIATRCSLGSFPGKKIMKGVNTILRKLTFDDLFEWAGATIRNRG